MLTSINDFTLNLPLKTRSNDRSRNIEGISGKIEIFQSSTISLHIIIGCSNPVGNIGVDMMQVRPNSQQFDSQ
jgi:hypothetical protein